MKFLQTHKKETALLFSISALLIAFTFFFFLIPKDAVVYFDGLADTLKLDTVNNAAFFLEFRSTKNDARIRFTGDRIFLLNNSDEMDLAEGIVFQDEATLVTNSSFAIRLEMPDDSLFPIQIEMYNGFDQVNLDEQLRTLCSDDGANLILMRKFPPNVNITLFSTSEIKARGDVDEEAAMSAGEYQVCNADGILIPIQYSHREKIIFQLSDFRIANHAKSTLEISQNSRTEFRDIGHVTISGQGKEDDLRIQLGDLGGYPFRVTLSGFVGPLQIAGESCYLTLPQWLTENMTEILIVFLGTIVAAVFTSQ